MAYAPGNSATRIICLRFYLNNSVSIVCLTLFRHPHRGFTNFPRTSGVYETAWHQSKLMPPQTSDKGKISSWWCMRLGISLRAIISLKLLPITLLLVYKYPLPPLTPWTLCISKCCCCFIAKSCLTLCNSMDCSSPGSVVHEIFQARILERVAISFSHELNPHLLHCRQILYHWRSLHLPGKPCISIANSKIFGWNQSCTTWELSKP